MKKLMILGGSRYIIPLINIAHKLGIYVITADFCPNNIAHKFSDEFVNVSVIEKELVLAEAQRRNIDGIVSFACDPGVVSAAYVSEKMGLPFQCSYKTACILQDKGLFREFLSKNGFNSPKARRYTEINLALNDADNYCYPVIVKPVDSAGSKGVTKVINPEDLSNAIKIALLSSHCHAFIIEEFLTFEGYHSSADPFTVNGELKFISYSDQLFDPEADNPYTPAYIIWPSSMKKCHQDELTREIQRLMNLLKMKTGIYNIESCVANGKPYIMEVSPRGGGCKIAELQSMAYGVNLIEAEVKKAVGLPLNEIYQSECKGFWCEMVVHARPGESGYLNNVAIEQDIQNKYLKVIDLSVNKGDMIKPFTGANMALGDLFLRFDSREEMNWVLSKQKEWLHIDLDADKSNL